VPIVWLATDSEAAALRALAPDATIVPKPVMRQPLFQALTSRLRDPRPATATQDSAATRGARIVRHVLVVEDNEINAEVACGYVAALGGTSVWAPNGAQAVARAAAEKFDAVLMDLSMPGMDGYAVANLIRQQNGPNNRVPIIALTAHEPAGCRDACLLAGMNDVMSKPYTLEQCAAMLGQWTGDDNSHTADAETARARVAGDGADLGAIDPAAADALRAADADGSAALYQRIVELFRRKMPADMDRLAANLASGDLAAAAAVCHKLRSACANVGARAFAGRLRQLEGACTARQTDATHKLHAALVAAQPALLDALRGAPERASAHG
jgi:CheY-like chemotaxis protein/HPt (histidine-containing phosphotransfer) domain-containing protein